MKWVAISIIASTLILASCLINITEIITDTLKSIAIFKKGNENDGRIKEKDIK